MLFMRGYLCKGVQEAVALQPIVSLGRQTTVFLRL